MSKNTIIKTSFAWLSFLVGFDATSQVKENKTQVSTIISTEGEYNFRNHKGNIACLLNVSIESPVFDGFSLQSNLLAAQNLCLTQGKDFSIAQNKQGFSNILLDQSLPLALFQFGINKTFGNSFSAFLGLRNMNCDYFTSDYTSLFTGSSYGMYPTIADNWSVGNYPASAFGLHLEWNLTDNLTLKNSLYNGKASVDWDKVFCFHPKSDGLINISQISYKVNEQDRSLLGEYHLGFVCANTTQETVIATKQANYSVFTLVQQPLYNGNYSLGLLLQAGFSIKRISNTYAYYSVGVIAKDIIKPNFCTAVSVNHALYTYDGNETDVELTFFLPITQTLSLQTALHCITTNAKTNTVGILRLNFEL